MAAAITTSSSTLEGQLLEVAIAMQQAEIGASTADVTLDNVQVSFDTDAGEAAITATLPVTLNLTSGAPNFSANAYVA